jgi:hypothetical protein
VHINPYVVLTVQLFQAQLLAARSRGDADRASALEAAVHALIEDSGSGLELAGQPASAPN